MAGTLCKLCFVAVGWKQGSGWLEELMYGLCPERHYTGSIPLSNVREKGAGLHAWDSVLLFCSTVQAGAVPLVVLMYQMLRAADEGSDLQLATCAEWVLRTQWGP